MEFLLMVDFHVADFLLLPGDCTIANAAAQTLQRHEGSIYDPVVALEGSPGFSAARYTCAVASSQNVRLDPDSPTQPLKRLRDPFETL
jgi:hypothetical protein